MQINGDQRHLMPFSVNVNKYERAIHPLHGKMYSAKALGTPFSLGIIPHILWPLTKQI